MTTEGVLPLETYARIAAAMAEGVPRDRAIAEASITLETWMQAHQAWLVRFAAEGKRLKTESWGRYQAIFLEARKTIAKRLADEKKAGSLPASSVTRVDPPTLPAAGASTIAAPLMAGLGSSPAQGPRLTLPQYASLCVELDLYPRAQEAIMRRYGFDAEGIAHEHAEWRWRLDADRHLSDQHAALFHRYRQWLLGARSTG